MLKKKLSWLQRRACHGVVSHSGAICPTMQHADTQDVVVIDYCIPGNFRAREKSFANFAVLWLFAKVFPAKFGTFGAAKSEQSAKVFSAKIVFFTNSRKFPAIR